MERSPIASWQPTLCAARRCRPVCRDMAGNTTRRMHRVRACRRLLRQPGASALRDRKTSFQGFRISGLSGMSSRMPQPVFSTAWISTGVWSVQTADQAALPPNVVAAPDDRRIPEPCATAHEPAPVHLSSPVSKLLISASTKPCRPVADLKNDRTPAAAPQLYPCTAIVLTPVRRWRCGTRWPVTLCLYFADLI